MSEKVSITKSKLDSLANAIASVGETSIPKTIAQMESAVLELTIPPNIASLTVTPTESQQVFNSDAVDGYLPVTVNGISSTYVGSGITQRDSTDLTASGATVTAPAGYYAEAASKPVTSGNAGTPTATKGTVSNHSISVTPSVTNTTGYITGSTINGTPVTVDVTELESGTKTITENGTGISVSGYSTVDVAVQAGTIIDDGNGNINLSPTGEVAVITPLTVNQNGTYTAPSGTAYSPVTVNVSSGGDDKLVELIERTITSFSIPNGVTKIGKYAFASCSDLNITSIPNTVTSIGEYAFYTTNSTLTTIPSGITTIPGYCFYSCSMTSFTVPVGVTTISDYAFYGCTKLASVSLPNTITQIRSYAFWCSIITTLECAGAITTLGDRAFLGNASFPSRLKSVSLPNMSLSGLSIAFGYATAASACQQLEFADIGNTKSISASAFENCYKLQTLILRRSDAICSLSNVSAFTNTPMRGYNSLTGTVYVPNDLISTYQSATNWSTLYNNGTVTFVKIEGSAYDLS